VLRSDPVTNILLEYIGEKESETMSNKEAQKIIDSGEATIPESAIVVKEENMDTLEKGGFKKKKRK